MKQGNIIVYLNNSREMEKAVVAKDCSETPNNIRIFNYPFNKNSKSCVLGLGKRRLSGNIIENPWDYCVTNKILNEKEKNLLETLVKNMGPLSDIR